MLSSPDELSCRDALQAQSSNPNLHTYIFTNASTNLSFCQSIPDELRYRDSLPDFVDFAA
jgi:hypothetical protein